MNPPQHLTEESQMFLRDKQAWENAIGAYSGSDPLELWYNYICWFDYNVHIDPENKFRETLEKCLALFEYNECYCQDIRMVKLWVKYIDLQPNPLNLYQILYQRGIGTQCASFYIGWSHYYDSANALKQAESVFNLGFQANAQPYAELQEAHTKFRLSVSQRMLYNDSSSKKRSASHLNEQRQQITTLNPPAKKAYTQSASTSSVESNVLQQPQNHHFQAQTQQQQATQQNQQQQQLSSQQQQLNNQQQQQYQQSQHNYSNHNVHIQSSSSTQAQQQQQMPSQQNLNQHHHIQSQQNYSAVNYPQSQQISTIQHTNMQQPNGYYHSQNMQQHIQQQSQTQNCPQAIETNQQNHQQNNFPQQTHSSVIMSTNQVVQHINEAQPQPANHFNNLNNQDNCDLNNSAYVISSSLNSIYGESQQQHSEDTSKSSEYPLENIKLPINYARYSRNNYETWKPTLFLEEPYDPNRRCIYQKHLVYPGDGYEYSPEEIRAKQWVKNSYALQQQQLQQQQHVSHNVDESNNIVTYNNNYINNNNSNTNNNNNNNNTIGPGHNHNHNHHHHHHHHHHSHHSNSHHNNHTASTAQKYKVVQHSAVYNSSENDTEDQIEASTIRFSTDANGATKNKTITIKFRRERPTPPHYSSQAHQQLQSNSSNSTESKDHHEIDDDTNLRPVEEMQRSYKQRENENYHHHSNGNSNDMITDPSNLPSSKEESLIHHSMPKIKKIKKIKIVNNYDDPKYLKNFTNSNESNHLDSMNNATYTNINNNNHNYLKKALSKNQYEDANLLLSFANINSTSSTSNKTLPIVSSSLSDAMTETMSASTATIGVNGNNLNETLNSDLRRTDVTLKSYNDDSLSNAEFSSTFNENSHLGTSSCSTPIRKLSQSYSSKTSTPLNYRSLKKHTSNVSLQNEDSMCSYEQNSFFATEHNDELKQKRLEKALNTIEMHFSKIAIDPFSTELCKSFLTKLNFPSKEPNDIYKVINNPIPKLSNTKVANLGDVIYNIEKEVGRGSYGSVYRAVNTNTSTTVALKYQRPPNTWELYICLKVKERLKDSNILAGFMDISSAVIAPNASILVTEFSNYGSLLDINNKLRQATKKVMHESLVMHFSCQILTIVKFLHSCKIIHADIKPDNFLLMRVPSLDSNIPSLRLIDFGCAVDMSLFPEGTQFKKVIQTDGFTCIEMQEGRPWSYQTDLFCVAATIHVMLFGEYMQLVKKFDQWDIKQKLPRYLKKQTWTEFFNKMLNIKDLDHLPNLLEMKCLLENELDRMDSELQTQIRTLSNLLHRR